MKERKDPKILTLVLFAMLGVSIIMFVFRTWDIGYGWELLACGTLGWFLRRIIWFLTDLKDSAVVKLNEWAKK
jgi:hypothetical protein